MPTIRQWEDSVIEMTTPEMKKVQEALGVLGKWELFAESYPEVTRLINTIVVSVHANRIINTCNEEKDCEDFSEYNQAYRCSTLQSK